MMPFVIPVLPVTGPVDRLTVKMSVPVTEIFSRRLCDSAQSPLALHSSLLIWRANQIQIPFLVYFKSGPNSSGLLPVRRLSNRGPLNLTVRISRFVLVVSGIGLCWFTMVRLCLGIGHTTGCTRR